MAKVKIELLYQAFACPECRNKVEPNQETFCNNCGVNLKFYKKIEKKTFYRSEEHEDWEICPRCKKPSVAQFTSWPKKVVEKHKNYRIERWVMKCWSCDYTTEMDWKILELERDPNFNPGT